MSKKAAFFSHKECEYFPCHKGVDPDNFNCLFCYCPLYVLGDRCGGNFRMMENGRKDCTNCGVPHVRGNYERILSRYNDIVKAMMQLQEMRQEHPETADYSADNPEQEHPEPTDFTREKK